MSARFARAASGVGLLGCLALGACVSAPPITAPSAPPPPTVAEECPRQVPRFAPDIEWKSERSERDFAAVDLQVTPCVEPGGELRITATVAGREGIGCWDDAGVEMHSLTGRGVLIEQVAPRIVVVEGGEASAGAPHFESAVGPWGVWMRRFATFGPGHRMHLEAVAQIAPDARPRELTLDFEVSAHRHDWDAYVFHGVSMKRTVRARIAARCE